MSEIPNFDEFIHFDTKFHDRYTRLFKSSADKERNEIFKVLKSEAAADYKKGILRQALSKNYGLVELQHEIFKKAKSDEEALKHLPLLAYASQNLFHLINITQCMFPEMESEITKKYSLDKIYESPAKRGAPPKEGNVVDYILPQYADSAEQKFNELKEFAKARDFTKGKAAQARRAIIQKAMEHFDRVPTKILLLDLFGEENPSDSEIKAWDRCMRESDWRDSRDREWREEIRNRKQN